VNCCATLVAVSSESREGCCNSYDLHETCCLQRCVQQVGFATSAGSREERDTVLESGELHARLLWWVGKLKGSPPVILHILVGDIGSQMSNDAPEDGGLFSVQAANSVGEQSSFLMKALRICRNPLSDMLLNGVRTIWWRCITVG
jgi:hypothetical protein